MEELLGKIDDEVLRHLDSMPVRGHDDYIKGLYFTKQLVVDALASEPFNN